LFALGRASAAWKALRKLTLIVQNIPPAEHATLGINANLVRLSIGIKKAMIWVADGELVVERVEVQVMTA